MRITKPSYSRMTKEDRAIWRDTARLDYYGIARNPAGSYCAYYYAADRRAPMTNEDAEIMVQQLTQIDESKAKAASILWAINSVC